MTDYHSKQLMNISDQKKVLDSFSVIVDTREQPTLKASRRYQNIGVPIERATLNYGDYTFNALLPNGVPIYDLTERVSPIVSIERKQSLDELAHCFTRNRERFQKEFLRAMEHRSKMYLICENACFENLIGGRYRSHITANAFMGSVAAFMVRYDINLLFCKEDTSGRLIKEILYRELKERLERGEYG